MSVGGYLARRLAAFVVTLLIASFAVFSLMYIAPGSPLTFVLGPRTTSPEQIAAVKARYHLDDPFLDALLGLAERRSSRRPRPLDRH